VLIFTPKWSISFTARLSPCRLSLHSTNVSKFYIKLMAECDAGKGKVVRGKEVIRASKASEKGSSSEIAKKRVKDPTPQRRTLQLKKEKKLKID